MSRLALGQPFAARPIGVPRGYLNARRTRGVPIGDYEWVVDAGRDSGDVSSPAANTKTSWRQYIAATTDDFDAILLNIHGLGSTGASGAGCLMDIATGAAGAEVPFINNLFCGYWADSGAQGAFMAGCSMLLPFRIPAGTRIATRRQSINGVIAPSYHMLFGKRRDGLKGPSIAPTTIGANAVGTSKGVALDLSAGVGADSAWTELIAATVEPYVGLIPLPGVGTDSSFASGEWKFDIGVGPSGGEQVIINDLLLETNLTEWIYRGEPLGPVAVPIPAGTRIAARANKGDASTTDMCMALLGIRAL